MLLWMNGEQPSSISSTSTFTLSNGATTDTHWAYLDYKDILEILDSKEAENVDWFRLGVVRRVEDEEAWRDSTIWIGMMLIYLRIKFQEHPVPIHLATMTHTVLTCMPKFVATSAGFFFHPAPIYDQHDYLMRNQVSSLLWMC